MNLNNEIFTYFYDLLNRLCGVKLIRIEEIIFSPPLCELKTVITYNLIFEDSMNYHKLNMGDYDLILQFGGYDYNEGQLRVVYRAKQHKDRFADVIVIDECGGEVVFEGRLNVVDNMIRLPHHLVLDEDVKYVVRASVLLKEEE